MFIKQVRVGSSDNFGYLFADERSKLAAIVDPSYDARDLQRLAEERGLRIVYIFNTHSHRDHIGDNERLARETGAKVVAHISSKARKDVSVNDGDVVNVGHLEVKVLHTPGHCPDACCFIVEKAIFTGDTLFVGECGRTDLPGSDVKAMHNSLLSKIHNLPDDLVVYPGHDYGKTPTSTIGYEKANNYTLKPRTLPEFIKFMNEP